MQEYNPKHQAVKKFEHLKSILQDGLNLNLDLNDVLKKVESVIETINNDVISIALIGSFSDGKTSTIAGLLGRMEDTMKIDTDESSDELKVYRPLGLKQGFEIIDTPGLFGTKEKEIDGKDVRFSEITERYLSQAHIILYLTGAVVPIKDSHSEVLKHILRDLNKLDSTIFVINKMDEAGIDLLDKDDFNHGASIKRDTITKRLQQTIELTEDEARRLNIVCISANPKGKGMEHWLSNMDSYLQRSHIGELRNTIDRVIGNSNVAVLKESAIKASINEIVTIATTTIENSSSLYTRALDACKSSLSEAKDDLDDAKLDILQSRNALIENLEALLKRTITAVKGASIDTIGTVIDQYLGVNDDKVSFYIFEEKIKMAINSCCDSNNVSLESASISIEKNFKHQDEFLSKALKDGVNSLKGVKIDAQMVDKVRNMFFKNYKFKPWGKINMAANITKWFGRAVIFVNIAIEAYDWYKRYKSAKKLDELKDNLINAINDYIKDILSRIANDEWYYTELAPAYNVLCDMVKSRENDIATIETDIDNIKSFSDMLKNWADVEDVEFEEI